MIRWMVFVVVMILVAGSVQAAEHDSFHWRIAPTKKLVFDPAVGLDFRSPALGLRPNLSDGQPGFGFGITMFSLDECRIRLLGVGFTADGHGGYLTLSPFSIRLSGEAGQGWNFAPVYLRRSRDGQLGRTWQGVGFQFSLRFSTRVDSDISPH